MRERLRHKLGSQRGASLLLALLFLFICIMVAASILMAAASDAGKRRSNQSQHQTHLALSSAVSLLCDELSRAEYQGQYTYTVNYIYENDEDGNPVLAEIRYCLNQEPGTYTGELGPLLLAGFDSIFAREIKNSQAVDDFYEVTTQSTTVTLEHALTLKPDSDTHLSDRPITVSLTITEDYAMYLTATLEDYTIRAELTPTESKPSLPQHLSVPGTYFTAPMTWTVGWITTGEEEAGS